MNNDISPALAGILGILCIGLGVVSYNTHQQLQISQKEIAQLQENIKKIEDKNSKLEGEIKEKDKEINDKEREIAGLKRDMRNVNITVEEQQENVHVLKDCLSGVVKAIDYKSAGNDEQAATSLLLVLDSCKKASDLY
ncbi:MAG TPA: hypothetical protein VK203_28900 [Nostocaceae cyanobacterium]|nr:hypothetical protein [Nostocaceae cyanobacterium]